MKNNIMEINNLKKYFVKEKGLINKKRTYIKAVNDVSFNIFNGETFGIVGESGCGKSTLARTLMLLIEPTDGDIIFKGKNISEIDRKKLRKEMSIVFQDPHSSLSPRRSIIKTIKEPFIIHNILSGKELKNKVLELLNLVGLKEEHLYRFPHEFSGGQKQRIGIARAISLNPKFLVLDEPTSALDVSVQSQILNLLQDLQQEMDLTMFFITHDLSVIEYIADRIAVMYMGKIVELGTVDQIFDNPLHPYTNTLLEAIPEPNPNEDMQEINIKGEIPSLTDLPKGCNFQTRCPYVSEKCYEKKPTLKEINNGHYSTCTLNK